MVTNSPEGDKSAHPRNFPPRVTEQDLLRCKRERFPRVKLSDGRECYVDCTGLIYLGRKLLYAEKAIGDPCDPEQIEAAKRWLLSLDPVAVKSGLGVNCYGWKHLLQRGSGTYISNGSGIVASFQVGLPLFPERFWSWNCRVGVSRRWLRSIESKLQGSC